MGSKQLQADIFDILLNLEHLVLHHPTNYYQNEWSNVRRGMNQTNMCSAGSREKNDQARWQ